MIFHSLLANRALAVLLGFFSGLTLHAAEPPEEYVSTAQQKYALREDLFTIEGKEAHVVEVKLAPGWVGERHFHTGDVFVYVVAGEFVVDVEGRGRLSFKAGEVYHEAVNTVMQARNLSATEPTEFLLFQVSSKGEPLMILAPETHERSH